MLSSYQILFILLSLFYCETFAQFSYFGRNKVQYTNFNWHVIKTEHFDIYYYPEFSEIAEIGAKFAEDAYLDLQIKFNHFVQQRIPLIFYNTHLHFQQTNTIPGLLPEGVGGFFEFVKGRVVIPSDGSLSHFRHVIRHELVHVFMTNKIYRILKDRRMITDQLPPLWFVEGLAEIWSTDWDSQAEMVLRDAVLNDYIVGLSDMDKIYGSYLMYKAGQKVLKYVADNFGEEKIYLLLENFWKSTNFEEVWEITLGKNFKEFDKDWLYSLKKEYYPHLTFKDPPSIKGDRLTKEGFNFSPNYFEIGGEKWIYFLANRDGYASIYRMLQDTTDSESTVELVLRGEKTDALESFHLFRTNFKISKSGLLVFSSKYGPTDVLHIFDVYKNKIIQTLDFEDILSITTPSWSDNSRKITFSAVDKKGYSDIYYYDLDKSELIRLTNDYYDDRQPIFSKNNKSIIFSSDRTAGKGPGNYNLFEINVSSLLINYITFSPFNSTNPIFSNDNKHLIFSNEKDAVKNLWTIDVTEKDGRISYSDRMYRVTKFTTSAFDANVSENNSLLFGAFENFSFQIYKFTDFTLSVDSLNEYFEFKFEPLLENWSVQKIESVGIKERLKYERHYNVDIAQSQIATNPVYGTAGGAVLTLSDLLSDDQYYFLVYNNAQTTDDFLESFNVAFTRLSLGQKTNYAYGVYHFSGRRYDIRDSDEYFYERSYGAYFGLSYPLSFFRRLEASVSLANSSKEVFGVLKHRKALLLTNSVSYVFDNSIWVSSGPIDGHRFLFLLAQTNDIKSSNVNYYTVMADYRHYLRLGLKSAFASRFQFFYNHGREARRFFMGGNWDLRGWPRWSIRGEKLWLTSFELRFPLVDVLTLAFPFGRMNLYEFRGAIFSDFGSAWDTKYKSTLGSIGFGLRMNLFGVLVLRYDMGKKIENNLTTFQKGLFYQFFFGWDF
ncbi:MAG: hypothetical protein KJ666_10215 [Bacteroidetes bacterium]|nr:hypothetical protein [Bacteroidota bacterium]